MGLSQARTAFPDGCIDSLRLLNGGSGYTVPPQVSFQTVHSAGGDSGSGAAAVATVTRGRVTGLRLTSCGEDYVEAPVVSLTGGGGRGARASASGVGLRVVTPLAVRRLDSIVSDAFEERAQIDFGVDYAVEDVQDTGMIDNYDCMLVAGNEILLS